MATSLRTNPSAEFPIFVKTDEDKIRWNASLDFITQELGLTYPKDIDMVNVFARSVFDNPEIPTQGLLSLTNGDPFNPNPTEPNPVTTPGRFDDQIEADPMAMRQALAQAATLKWTQDTDDFTATINGAEVSCPQTPSQTVAARLCYLLVPVPKAMGDDISITLSDLPAPSGDPDNPSMVTSTDGNVTFWSVQTLNGGGAKIEESVFDYTVARSLVSHFGDDYTAAALADQAASQDYALKYQLKYNRSLGDDLAPIVVVGAPFSTIWGKDQPPSADFCDSLSLWLQATRHGYLAQKPGITIKYADVFPNRDEYFRAWK